MLPLRPRLLVASSCLGALLLAAGCGSTEPTDDAGGSTKAEGEAETAQESGSETDASETDTSETDEATETGPPEEPEPPGPEDYPQCECAPDELCVASCADAPGFPPPDYIPCDVYCFPAVPDCPRYEDPQEYCDNPECLPADCNGSCDPFPLIPPEFIPVLGYEAFCDLI